MTTSTASAARGRNFLLIGLAYAAFISLGLPDGLTGVAWPTMRIEFGLSLEALGALTTSGTIGYLISSFSSGRLMSRLGVGALLALSCLATAVTLLGNSAAPFWLFMVVLGFLGGFGAGAIDAGLNTYAAENFSPRTMNWLHASFGLGAAIGPLLMSSVIGADLSWRIGYLIVGVAQLILASLFAATRSRWQANVEGAPGEPAATPLWRTLRLPAAWLSIVLFFLYTGVEITAGIWFYSLLTEARGMEPALGGLWVSIYWGSLTAGRLVSGAIVARISVRTMLQICMLGAVLSMLLIWQNFAPWLSGLGIAMLGLVLAPMFPSLMSLTPERMGPAHAANTIGFQVSGAALGGAALVTLFGLLAARFGLEALGPFLLVAAVLMWVMFQLLERQRKA